MCSWQLFFNSDSHVALKLLRNKEVALSVVDRRHLAQLSTAELPWMDASCQWRDVRGIVKEWPELKFVHFTLNGADDVCKYRKWAMNRAKGSEVTSYKALYNLTYSLLRANCAVMGLHCSFMIFSRHIN